MDGHENHERGQGEEMKQMRIDKFLTECGAGSRSGVKQLLRKGLVTVNGEIVRTPEMKIVPGTDSVICEGRILYYEPLEYLMLNKPAGCVTAVRDSLHRTVMEYLGAEHKADLAPVGRLDLDTEGLLILTNDGELAHRMLAPKSHVDKVYFARVLGCVTEEDVRAFAEGLEIGEKRPTLPAKLEILISGEISEILLTVCEGKFHQVKRMFEAQGKKVLYLKRTAMGGIVLDDSLEPGQWRRLTEEEIKTLRQNAGM